MDRVEHDSPYTYEALISQLPPRLETREDLLAYGSVVCARLNAWWRAAGRDTDFWQPGRVYYGEVSLHEVFERTAWHSGQRTRQLMLTLEKLRIAPTEPLTDADFAGLPMPKNVWDNEKSWD